jgi:hypothetical protein
MILRSYHAGRQVEQRLREDAETACDVRAICAGVARLVEQREWQSRRSR